MFAKARGQKTRRRRRRRNIFVCFYIAKYLIEYLLYIKGPFRMAAPTVVMEEKTDAIDRQKVCPFLLRVFVSSNGSHYKPSDYIRGNTPQNELQIYTWKDATLHELTQLVKEVNPEARRKGTKFSFAFVFPDSLKSVYRITDIGNTMTGVKGPDDLKTLGFLRLNIGDYLDIAITPPDTWNSVRKGYSNNNYNNRSRPY